MIEKKYLFQSNNNDQFNDIIYPGSAYTLIDVAYSISIKPKTKFWRFGIRFSKTEKIEFSKTEDRHFEAKELYKDIHLSVGNWDSEKSDWFDEKQLNFVQYNLNENHVLFNCKYFPRSEILWNLSFNSSNNSLYINLFNDGSYFNGVYNLGPEYKWFKMFAWADYVPFELDLEFVIRPESRLVMELGSKGNSFVLGNIHFRWGDMFDSYYGRNSSVVLLPVSRNGRVSSKVAEKIELFDFKNPNKKVGLKNLKIEMDSNGKPSYGYCYSIDEDFKSSIKLVSEIAEEIISISRNWNGELEFNIPLFGVGSGKLLPEEIVTIYDKYFNDLNVKSKFIVSIYDLSLLYSIRDWFIGNNIVKVEDVAYVPQNIKDLRAIDFINIERSQYDFDKNGDTRVLHLSNLRKNHIISLKRFPKLKKLSLINSDIEYPLELIQLTKIEVLDLSSSRILNLSFLEDLKRLRVLKLDECNIQLISFDFNLSNLESLSLNSLKLKILDKLPERLPNLKYLSLSNNGIVDIKKIAQYETLVTLDLSKNEIRVIQPLEKLELLIVLNLNYNRIENLNGIEKLTNIEVLQITNNEIVDVPLVLSLGKLRYLRCNANPFVSRYNLYLENENHISTIFNILKKLNEEDKTELILPAKVLLLGNHRSGKSSLLQYLISNKIFQTKSTHIIKIEKYFNSSNDIPEAIFYDFGGQDYYHGIYRAFISGGSVNLVLWNNESNLNAEFLDSNKILTFNFSINYWLHQIKYLELEILSDSDPLLTIQTHSDIDRKVNIISNHFVNELDIRNEFYVSLKMNNEDDEVYSSKYKVNVKALQYLKESIDSLIKERQKKVIEPKWYIDFFKYILEKNTSDGYLPTKLTELLKEYKRDDEDKINLLITDLDQFNRQGLVLFYKNTLPDVVWLNPVALVEYVHNEVLSLESVGKYRGVVPEAEFLKFDQNIIDLLCHQKVIFKHNGGKGIEFITPNFLPLSDEDNDFLDLYNFGLENIIFVLRFSEFIPFGMINQIICHFNNLPKSKKFWRNQLMFTIDDKSKILINLDFRSLVIKVYASFNSSVSSKEKEIIPKYIFYSIIGLYWDLTLFDFHEFQEYCYSSIKEKIEFESESYAKKVEDYNRLYLNEDCFPRDLELSLDNKWFIKYIDLFDIKNKSKILATNYEKEETREIYAYPFQFFTSTKLNRMKKIFISYSKHDEEYKEEFRKHLVTLKEEELVEDFNCKQIDLGVDWDATIQREIEECDILICLISVDFLNTDYIRKYEVDKAIEKGKVLVPIIIKPCDWENSRIGRFYAAERGHVISLNKKLFLHEEILENTANERAAFWTKIVKEMRVKLFEN